ncbi:ATP-dependent zinc metalloprotease FtsH [Symbiodinium microadriaticum]|uniref:ATP-dependent zinc metalloprotease FtsH n=1 Tax=Symbiodinium microadriaticum TaxID=2951 RepID=A0A1Q9E6G7_SYMMI|nr:ATP-dependent zinc metalloprotease FtsH [Symbiodinium microadriaticum]
MDRLAPTALLWERGAPRRPSIPEVVVLPCSEPVEPEPAPQPAVALDAVQLHDLPEVPEAEVLGEEDSQEKGREPPVRSSLLQVLPEKSQRLDSRGSVASSRLSSYNSEGSKSRNGSKEPPRLRARPKKEARRAEVEDKLSNRLRVLEAESRWSDRRRDLRRYIRELPDSSKSRAKQKLVGQKVTGTLLDKTRLETQKAKDTQAALRRRLGMHSMGRVEWQSGGQEAREEEEGGTGGTTDAQSDRDPAASISSSHTPVYVGRGASRVRDLFRQARSMAPVVLFLDELDALGTRSRGQGGLGGGEEYVQTLNQILTELDGFHGHGDGIVVLGATNRQEAIDPALLRPGRFDRFIQVDLPDEEERKAIFRIHVRKADENLSVEAGTVNSIASSSAGFSGAELANVVNEAIFLALRSTRSQPTAKDFSDALDRRKVARQAVGCGSSALNGDASGLGFRMPRPWPKATAA